MNKNSTWKETTEDFMHKKYIGKYTCKKEKKNSATRQRNLRSGPVILKILKRKDANL